MFFRLKKKLKLYIFSDLYELFRCVQKPIFLLCLITIILPTLLLCILCGWKAILFSGSMPSVPLWLVLPLFALLAGGIPAFSCAALLSLPHGYAVGLSRILIPLQTYHLLVSDLYLLLLIYHAPYVFCLLSALAMCLSAAVSIGYMRHLSRFSGGLLFLTLLFDTVLFFMTCGF